MDGKEAVVFCGALEETSLPLLAELDLNNNPLGEEGAAAFAAALTAGKFPAVKILHVQNTGIGARGNSLLRGAKAKREGLQII